MTRAEQAKLGGRTPSRYREVSVADVGVPLEPEPLRRLLTARPAYRRTRYLVARNGQHTALLELVAAARTDLFTRVDDVVLLAGPQETEYVVRPDLDTAVPSELARAAREAPQARCVVVEGRYGHVSFILDPVPIRLRVLDVVPPLPAKLVNQVERLLWTADDLPALQVVPDVVDLADLLPTEPSKRAAHYLFQCRGGGMEVDGSTVSYLDEVPARQDWTLLGCARSRQIHDFFYPGGVPQIDTCPRNLARRPLGADGSEQDATVLTKCCLLEEHVETEGRLVVVPWGATFGQLRTALEAVVEQATAQGVLADVDGSP